MDFAVLSHSVLREWVQDKKDLTPLGSCTQSFENQVGDDSNA